MLASGHVSIHRWTVCMGRHQGALAPELLSTMTTSIDRCGLCVNCGVEMLVVVGVFVTWQKREIMAV